ncbi:MAG: ZIP family metal transporter [Candidatus Pacebacteria bacterium]|nr:ZIP family metal transporter [Candidatus Paceibacterota bacterium]
MFEIILYSFLIMLASLIGVISVWKFAKQKIEKNINFLVSFSAGVFLVVAYHLGNETITNSITIKNGLFWIFIGMIGIWILSKITNSFHHHHTKLDNDNCCKINPIRIIMNDAVHNIGDGILLTSAFIINSSLGMITALSIFIHELIQEISEFFILKQANYSIKKILIINFLVSSTILIGSIGSFFILEKFETIKIPLLGIITGSFLIVILYDLIPHSIRKSTNKIHYIKHIIYFIIGVILMTILNIFTSH